MAWGKPYKQKLYNNFPPRLVNRCGIKWAVYSPSGLPIRDKKPLLAPKVHAAAITAAWTC